MSIDFNMALLSNCRLSKHCRNVCGIFLNSCLHENRSRCLLHCELLCSSYSTDAADHYDVIVVGGGIVGMAAAREISLRYPNLKMAVLDKENDLAQHQTGHNSGVIHAGIYYKPGSLKAKLCVEGLHLMYQYCDAHQIPYKKAGKLIVSTNPLETERLDDLEERAKMNNVPGLERVGKEKIKEIEPYCEGDCALYSPHTGIVDYSEVTRSYGKDFTERGGKIYCNFEVYSFAEVKESAESCKDEGNRYPVYVHGCTGDLRASYVLTCGGLQSDKLAQMSGGKAEPKIVPFRGEYLLLSSEKTHLVRGNIYPVPDPRYPFLGVHFTPRMDGSIWLGPNAVLALRREGYSWGQIDVRELWDSVSYSGFRKMALKNSAFGISEMMKSIFLRLQLKGIQKFIPGITANDLRKGPAGVRAQAMDPDGTLVDDFVFDIGDKGIGKRVLHCRNVPSPGATSSLAIAKMIANKAEIEFGLK